MESDELKEKLKGFAIRSFSGKQKVISGSRLGIDRRSFFAQVERLCAFLDASSHLYKSVCPSVDPSVRRSVRNL